MLKPQQIVANLEKVRQQIHSSCQQCGRDPATVSLLAVSKTHPVAAVEAAYQAGQTAFGENYLQEAIAKIDALQDLPLTWHFIGRIQSNKTRAIAAHFDWVHTLSSLKHARRLHEQRPPQLPPLNICVQVNISHEDSKAGVPETEVASLAAQIAAFSNLRLRGLMTIPAVPDDEHRLQGEFTRMRTLLDELNQQGLQLDTLSMGMSADLHTAIAAGSTVVRIGTAIFGDRERKLENP